MKKSAFLSAVLFAALLTGCASTEIYDDPAKQPDDIRDEQAVSSAEMRKSAIAAVNDALQDEDFLEFVNNYRAKYKKRPMMKLEAVRNDTDTHINTTELTGFVENALRKSRKIRITRYEGDKRMKSIGASRNNIDDPNFRPETVAQEGTIEAAVLIMKPTVISNTVSSGRAKRITRTFTIEIVTINGELIMKSDYQLGFKKTRGVVGW